MKFLAVILLAASSALGQPRTEVALDPAEREHVLGEMRGFLVTVERFTSALAKGDFGALAAAAPAAAPHERMRHGFAQKLPPAFRKLAFSTHEQLAAIGADASRRDARHSLEQVSRLLQTCNACHAAYQLP
ncbi:MAG TPA: hypothetical protein VFK84_07195 [Burkholderiales bacterium]|nr:hypothetical protein [Burkholderiales bacterium]